MLRSVTLNATIRNSAVIRGGELTTAQVIADIRAGIGSLRHNAFVTPLETLTDILVHSQDIARPLGRTLPLPPEGALIAARRVWSKGWPFHPRRRLAGLRLVAADTDWAAGEGPEIRGTTADLLLVLTGRGAAALDDLEGDGVPELRRRLDLATSRG